MPKCQKCGKELTVKNGVYVCVDCKLKYSTIPVPTEEHHEKVVQTTQPIQKSVEVNQPVEEPVIQSAEKKPKRKWTRKTKEERKADQIGTNYGRTQYAMGMLLLLFGIIPGIVIALATGNRKTIAGMKMGLVILLILALSAGIITGLVFAGIAIDTAIEEAKSAVEYECSIGNHEESTSGSGRCKNCGFVIRWEENGFTYIYDKVKDGYEVVQNGNTSGDVIIFSSIHLKSVVTIGESAFEGCNNLTSIVIPDSVTTIEAWAFYGCTSLTSVTFGDNSQLTTIGEHVFEGCDSLKSIVIPDSVTIIEMWAFYGCDSLKDVYYTGTEAKWNSIEIDSGNNILHNATIHFNYVP